MFTLHKSIAAIVTAAGESGGKFMMGAIKIIPNFKIDNPNNLKKGKRISATRIMATDGHAAIVVDHVGCPADAIGKVPGFVASEKDCDHALINATEFSKALDSKSRKRIKSWGNEDASLVSMSGKSVVFGSRNGKFTNISQLDNVSKQGEFPDIDGVFPTKDPIATVRVNPSLLSKILDAVSGMQDQKSDMQGGFGVEMQFFGKDKPIVIYARGNEVQSFIRAVVMPLK